MSDSKCYTGHESSWDWVTQCDDDGNSSFICGDMVDNYPVPATCIGNATVDNASVQTTSSASRYISPSSIDTDLYSLYTQSYTTVITAYAQSTILTTTFQSTLTSRIGQATNGPVISGTSSTKNKVVLSSGVLVAIIAGPIVAIAIVVGIFFLLRSDHHGRATRQNSPPNLHTRNRRNS